MKLKLTLFAILLLLIVWLVVIVILEKKQNELYVNQTTHFSELVTFYNLEQYDKVIYNSDKIYSYDPKAFDILLLLAKSYYELGDYENAINTIEELLLINPYLVEDVELLILLANSLIYVADSSNSENSSNLNEVMIQLESLHIPAQSFKDYQLLKNKMKEMGIQI